MLNEAAIASFKADLRGELIQPGDEGYDAARQVYNAMIDRRPRLIAKCVDVADVIAAVRFGREQNLLVAVRGGAHNAGGLGVCDDGLVIDLSRINYVRVDPPRRRRFSAEAGRPRVRSITRPMHSASPCRPALSLQPVWVASHSVAASGI